MFRKLLNIKIYCAGVIRGFELIRLVDLGNGARLEAYGVGESRVEHLMK